MSLYALRARTGASSGRSKMGKTRMEAGDWLGHGGMVRGGARTVQVRGDLEKNAAMVTGKGQRVIRGTGKAEEREVAESLGPKKVRFMCF